MARRLAELGCSMNARDRDGQTALMLACRMEILNYSLLGRVYESESDTRRYILDFGEKYIFHMAKSIFSIHTCACMKGRATAAGMWQVTMDKTQGIRGK